MRPVLLSLASLALLTTLANASPNFKSGFLSYIVPYSPYSIAVADLDRDGHADILAQSYQSSQLLVVLHGNGVGGFTIAESLATNSAEAVATGDLNGDGKPDIVVTGTNVTSVFLGNGDLTFQPRVDYGTYDATHAGSYGLALADFNGDGKLDVAASDSAGLVRVWPGLGNGALGVPIARLPALPVVVQMVAADLNGDGRTDLVFSETTLSGVPYQLAVFINQGGGQFDAGTFYAADTSAGVAVGDVDGDGKLDLVAGARWFKGNGDGTFAAPVLIGSGTETYPALADLDYDGHLDLVTLGAAGPIGYFRVRHGNGDGTFGPATLVTTGGGPQGVVVADVDGDGRLDVVTVVPYWGQVCVHHGLGPAGFQSGARYDAGCDPTAVAIADVTGDSHPDVVVAGGALMRILPGNGDTTLDTPTDYAIPAGMHRVAIGDVNGDGIPDIVTANDAGSISYFRGTGGGTFAPRVDLAAPGPVNDVAIGDVGGDGINDVIAVGSSVSVFPGQLGTSLGARADYTASGERVAVGFIDADSRADVVALGEGGLELVSKPAKRV